MTFVTLAKKYIWALSTNVRKGIIPKTQMKKISNFETDNKPIPKALPAPRCDALTDDGSRVYNFFQPKSRWKSAGTTASQATDPETHLILYQPSL